ncbi:hypothetical protein ACH5RR_039296 [Cinchona calisaya]|uniref:Biogenesis of lysosome-related organelles complex 1 subunit 5 n=1 Tax=Cinchona calisaya TaxID=153742 RepID=A0ABD2XYC3_9GENT
MEGGLSGTTSGAESAKASFSCSEAGVGKQVSVEAQPQGEGSSNFEAGPSSRKEEKDLNLNLSSHPRRATEELFNDLLQADRRLDELMGKAPSLQNARDLDAWGRELKKEQECFAETEQRLKWAIENEKELYAAQDEKWAQQKADLHSQIEPFLQQEATEKRRAREALFSQVSQEAQDQYELDRKKEKQRFFRR